MCKHICLPTFDFYVQDVLSRSQRLFYQNVSPYASNEVVSLNFCPYCQYSTPYKGHLRTHTGERPFSCKTCDKKFRYQSHVQRHMLTHTGLKSHICELCGKAFGRSDALRSHKTFCKGNKVFTSSYKTKSSLCGAKCEIITNHITNSLSFEVIVVDSMEFLVVHVTCIHQELSEDILLSVSHITVYYKIFYDGAKRPIGQIMQCEYCNYTSSYSSNFKRHMQIHSGERPFNCTLCSYTSSLRCNFKRHMFLNTGERPFKCNACNRAFMLKENLRSHLSVHSNVKPYACKICSRSFRLKCQLKYHSVGGVDTHYSSFKSLDPSSFVYKMSERMDEWNPPESWKRITSILIIRAGHQNKDIMTAAQCFLNTVKTIRHELETCNGDYEDVARRKIPSRRSVCVRTAEFLANLQEQIGLRCKSQGNFCQNDPFSASDEAVFLNLCPYCPYTSRYKGNLLMHIRIHTGERPFSCKVCGKTFRNQSHVKRHMLTHACVKS
ncbi:zinc finger protein 845-like [Stegodyphus dumicola]|uniref:zinc finger protein 845-like n=1 Tax=Stegodyphus dumicola TaxID=202533 RepID=UPI0015ADC0F5|nr:zinc finger protein 845-like [Stegodyphus dumicola]